MLRRYTVMYIITVKAPHTYCVAIADFFLTRLASKLLRFLETLSWHFFLAPTLSSDEHIRHKIFVCIHCQYGLLNECDVVWTVQIKCFKLNWVRNPTRSLLVRVCRCSFLRMQLGEHMWYWFVDQGEILNTDSLQHEINYNYV